MRINATQAMPVPTPDGRAVQLIEVASLSGLEARMRERGLESNSLWTSRDDWDVADDLIASWIADAARGLAHAIGAAASVIDFEAALIDGWLPSEIKGRLVEATRTRLLEINVVGLLPPGVVEGSVGPDARALGAASLPLSERFLASSVQTTIGM